MLSSPHPSKTSALLVWVGDGTQHYSLPTEVPPSTMSQLCAFLWHHLRDILTCFPRQTALLPSYCHMSFSDNVLISLLGPITWLQQAPRRKPWIQICRGDSLVPYLAMMAVKCLWKLGSDQASTPRRDLSLPFLWLISSPTQSSREGRERLLPRSACEEMDSSLPLGNRSKNKLPNTQHFLWYSGDNLAMLEPARGDLRQSKSKALRTMDKFGQLVTFTGRALPGNHGEAQKVLCQSTWSVWEETLPWKGVTGYVNTRCPPLTQVKPLPYWHVQMVHGTIVCPDCNRPHPSSSCVLCSLVEKRLA